MLIDLGEVFLTLILVLLNGFFVAAEFAFITARPSRIEELVRNRRPSAQTAQWLQARLDGTLAACQLGITMASLALGWIGEPAVARLIEPAIGMITDSPGALHAVAFVLAFTTITALHLVIGEQVPKIFAIRRPEQLALRCAGPMKAFYLAAFPFLWALNKTTSAILKRWGVDEETGHEAPRTENEIRALLVQARSAGELSRTEHKLLHAVFEFDDTICRRIMIPKSEIEFFRANQPIEDCLEVIRRTKHTRYPICESSLDDALGVLHIKDLVGVTDFSSVDLRSLVRPPKVVAETMPISRLLQYFQAVRQHFALVADEFGNIIGAVTLENVLEQIVGQVEDEFDTEQPRVTAEQAGMFLAAGGAALSLVNKQTGLHLESEEADTISGFVTSELGRMAVVGDRLELDGAAIEVLEVASARASKMRIHIGTPSASPDA